MSPTLLSTWAAQRLRLRSYPRGKRALVRLATLARTSSLLLRIGVGRKIRFGNAGLTTVNTRETSATLFWIYLSNGESSGTRSSHVIRQEKTKSRFTCLCRSLIQKEKEFFLSIEKSAISLTCDLIMLLKEKKLLYQGSLERNIIRYCFLRNRRIICCLKPDPSWICKNWGSKMQTELSKNQVYSFTIKGWAQPSESVIWSLQEREDSAKHRNHSSMWIT